MTDTVPADTADPLPHRVPRESLAELADRVGSDVADGPGVHDGTLTMVALPALPGAGQPRHDPVGPLIFDELAAALGDPRVGASS